MANDKAQEIANLRDEAIYHSWYHCGIGREYDCYGHMTPHHAELEAIFTDTKTGHTFLRFGVKGYHFEIILKKPEDIFVCNTSDKVIRRWTEPVAVDSIEEAIRRISKFVSERGQ